MSQIELFWSLLDILPWFSILLPPSLSPVEVLSSGGVSAQVDLSNKPSLKLRGGHKVDDHGKGKQELRNDLGRKRLAASWAVKG